MDGLGLLVVVVGGLRGDVRLVVCGEETWPSCRKGGETLWWSLTWNEMSWLDFVCD